MLRGGREIVPDGWRLFRTDGAIEKKDEKGNKSVRRTCICWEKNGRSIFFFPTENRGVRDGMYSSRRSDSEEERCK